MRGDDESFGCQPLSGGEFECGDRANWFGHWHFLSTRSRDYNYTSHFKVGFGAFVREKDPDKTYGGFGAYYKNPWDGVISRDQLTGILAGVIKDKSWKTGFEIFIHALAWLFLFSYNTRKNGQIPETTRWKWPDFTGPRIWGLYIRALGNAAWLCYPILCVLDLSHVLHAIIHRFRRTEHVISALLPFFISRSVVPTPTAWIAGLIHSKKDMSERSRTYWTAWRGQLEISMLYHDAIKRYCRG